MAFPMECWRLYTLANRINRFYFGDIYQWIDADVDRSRRTSEILDILCCVPTLDQLNNFSCHMIREFRFFIEELYTDPPLEFLLIQDLNAMMPILFYIQEIDNQIRLEREIDEILPFVRQLF